MDFRKRRRLIASKIKPLSLYEAGWSSLQNCTIQNSQMYSFETGYLQIGSGSSSETAFGRLHFTDIVGLNKYKRLCITYYAPNSSRTIAVGNISSSLTFTSVQTGTLEYETDATIAFNIDSSWSAVRFYSPGRSALTLKIYKIWLEG